jgi:hypothetical protein
MDKNLDSFWGEIEGKGFLKVPEPLFQVLEALGFTAGEKLVVLGVMSWVRNEDFVVSVSRKELEGYAQVVSRTVTRAIIKMREAGMSLDHGPVFGVIGAKASRYNLAGFIATVNTKYLQMEKKRIVREMEAYKEKDKHAVRLAAKEEAGA